MDLSTGVLFDLVFLLLDIGSGVYMWLWGMVIKFIYIWFHGFIADHHFYIKC